MSKIWIPGGTGMLGTAFCELFKLYPKHQVLSTGHNIDITSITEVINVVKGFRPDYIINCAAYTNVDAAETNQEKAWSLNVDGPKNIALVSKEFNIIPVHFSTDYIFDGLNVTYNESSGTLANPLNYYGKTKLHGEHEFCSNDESILIRTSWVFSEIGNNFVRSMLRIFQENSEVQVINDQLGKPTYAPHLAMKTFELLFETNSNKGIWHITNSGITSWYALATNIYRIGRELGLVTNEVKIVPVTTAEYEPKRPATRPKTSILETKRIESIGEPLAPWKTALRECLLKIKEAELNQ